MTSTGAFPRALAAARPPKPPPTITTRGLFASCASAPLIELRLESFIHSFLKPLCAEISENLGFSRRPRSSGQRRTDGLLPETTIKEERPKERGHLAREALIKRPKNRLAESG